MLPKVVFVLGKGGVGRSTIAAGLAEAAAKKGKRALVLGWTVSDPIAPWYGRDPAGVEPVEIAPRLSVVNFRLEATLRAYFVDHLHLGPFYRRVVDGAHVRRLIEAAPGVAELLLLGQLWWLTTLAPEERGFVFDAIVVDAPATGHASSLLELPEALASIHATGLLGLELERVTGMMRDPRWTGALVVATPEELVMEETRELLPRTARALGRPPLAAVTNRSARALYGSGGWVSELAVAHAAGIARSLASRVAREDALARSFSPHFAVPEIVAATPREIVRVAAAHLEALA